MLLEGSYNPLLVVLSFAISVLGSYAALRVAGRIPAAGDRDRLTWVALAGFTLGSVGIWSMHFIGMLALDVGRPVGYGPLLTVFSLLLAFVITAAGFHVAWVERFSWGRCLGAGCLMGAGIAAMHYSGMAAMRLAATMSYDLTIVAISILIAAAASVAALWIAFHARTTAHRIGGALVMGAAVCGMHYTGMAAVTFRATGTSPMARVAVPEPLLALAVFLVAVLTLGVSMSIADAGLRRTRRYLRTGRWLKPAGVGVLVVAVALMPLAVGWWVHGILQTSLEERLRDDLQTVLEADVTALRVWLREQQGAAQVAASEPAARQIIGQLVASGDPDGVQGEQRRLGELRGVLSPVMKMYGADELYVVDKRGRFRGHRLESVGDDAPLQRAVETILTGRPALSLPFLIRAEGRLENRSRAVMLAGSPVAGPDGATIGGLLFRLDPAADFTEIMRVARPGESGETYAFNAAGVLISESRFLQQLRQLGLLAETDPGTILRIHLRDPGGNLVEGFEPALPLAERPLTRMAAAALESGGGVDVAGYRDYRGVPVVGAWTWLEEQGLGVATEIDVAEAFSRLDQVRNAFWALIVLLTLATVGILIGYRTIGGLKRSVEKARRLGQYSLDRKIGEGGMGVVYRASHAMLRRPTAIKLLRSEKADEERIARYEREVRLTAQLTHPNTVAIYDYGRTPDGIFYYAMEYLTGLPLDRLVATSGPQPAARVIHILAQACGSLAEAHAKGLVHRDIKPSNIMLCERGGHLDVVKVLDFGLVKDIGNTTETALTMEGAVPGTPTYVSPEAIEAAGGFDHRSDLYSLGAVGYFLLTATPVFQAENAFKVMSDHLRSDPQLPSERLGRPVPSDLEAVLMACLAKDPNDRPADAGAFYSRMVGCEAAGQWTQREARQWWAEVGIVAPDETPEASISSDMDQTLAIALEGRISGSDSRAE